MPIGDRRRHTDDSDEHGGADRKRRRGPEVNEIEHRLENLIVRVGEKSTSSLESNLEGLAQVLETDLETYKSKILAILKTCVLDAPEKLTIYSTLVGLLNAKNHNFGGEFVEMLMKQLRDELIAQNYDNALHVIVFMCDLVNCRVVSAHSCMSFLEGLIEVAFQEDIPQVRSDWFVYAVLYALPWVGAELTEKKGNDLKEMLDAITRFLEQRQKLHVQMLRVWSGDKPHVQEEYLDCLAAQVTKLRTENWQEKHIARHYVAFDAVLCDALQHNLPSFVPAGHQETSVYPLPTVIFRLFDYTDCPENGPVLPGAHSIERFLVEEELNWIVRRHYIDRKECAAALLNYSRKLRVPLNYVILEVVFGQLFRLPSPPCPPLFYGSLLIELCKLQPNSMPQVLAQAAELLYQRVETMQPACVDRLVDWFSYHLSNFQYRWSWADWEDCLKCDELAPKQVFAREVLVKCMRFSYHQRVQEIVPADYEPLIPEKPQVHFKYSGEEGEKLLGASVAHQVAQAIRNKCTNEEALELLKNCPNPDEMSGFNPLAIDVFVSVLLHLGSKSFSHSFAALTRYHQALKTLTEGNEDAQMVVLRALYDLWKNHQQMMTVLVDKLLKMQIVECNCVVSWIFSDEMKPQFLRQWTWEVMQSALVKLSRHVQRLRAELEAADNEDTKEDTKEDSEMKADEDDEQTAESKSADAVKEKTQKLRSAEEFQRNLLLSVFHSLKKTLQKFTILLTEHLLTSEAEGRDFNSYWYKWVTGRFKQIFLSQSDEVWKLCSELETSLFTNDIDSHILEIFHQFRALRR